MVLVPPKPKVPKRAPRKIIRRPRGEMYVYRFLLQYFMEHGYWPSYEEIAEDLGVRSRSGVGIYLRRLQEQGKLTMHPGVKGSRAFCIPFVHRAAALAIDRALDQPIYLL